MGNPYSFLDGYVAIGRPTALFRNGDAAIAAAANLKSSDTLHEDWSLKFAGEETSQFGSTTSRYFKRVSTRDVPGNFKAVFELNSFRFANMFFGACTTTEGSPDQHVWAIRTTNQPPYYIPIHTERENDTDAESERWDLLGCVGKTWHIACSEEKTLALQDVDIDFAKHVAGNDIAEPTPVEDSHRSLEWGDFTLPTFTYNSETIEADILGFDWTLTNKVYLGGFVAHYPTRGLLFNCDIQVKLRIMPDGKNIFELLRTRLVDYLTDIDITWKFTETANRYIQGVHDKTYCQPFDVRCINAEVYDVTFHQLDTGSFVPTEHNELDDDWYEDP